MKKQAILKALLGVKDEVNEVRLTTAWGRTYKVDSGEIFYEANNNSEPEVITLTHQNEVLTLEATSILCVRVLVKED